MQRRNQSVLQNHHVSPLRRPLAAGQKRARQPETNASRFTVTSLPVAWPLRRAVFIQQSCFLASHRQINRKCDNNATMILHIAHRTDWEAALAAGEYRLDTLDSEGFIHCSTPQQVLGPANEFYRGQSGLVLLVIDPHRLTARLVFEDCYETGTAFPHIYGPLNLDAVSKVVPFPPRPDGTFDLPLL